MTLRSRLLVLLIGIVAAGLLISDAVTYTQLRSFLLARVDPQLQVASFTLSRALEATNGISPPLPFLPTTGGTSGSGVHGGTGDVVPHFPPFGVRAPRHSSGGLEPAGTVGELVRPDGRVYGKPLSVIYSGRAPSPPTLPHPLPATGQRGYAIFDASGAGGAYRVIERPLHYQRLTLVVAIPLSDVTDTLGRLLLVELLVSGAVLGGLAVLAAWIVRRGLRPLDEMAVAAGEIAGGELGRRVSPSDDRTEVGRLGQALNAMLGEIEEAFTAQAASEARLRRFLADASHELRTPLTSIRGYAELFELGAKHRPADLALSMHHIREAADRMNLLVDDLLLLARLNRERPLDLEPADIVPVCRRATEAAQLVSPDHRIALEAPDHLVMACDTERLRQVIDNLVSNALDHSPDGAPVEVGLHRHNGQAILRVRDHGSGVAEEDAEQIFEPFHRADFARARRDGGAGLGLAIVASIARAHGGSVGVRRADGGGAEFWVGLPVGPVDAEEPIVGASA